MPNFALHWPTLLSPEMRAAVKPSRNGEVYDWWGRGVSSIEHAVMEPLLEIDKSEYADCLEQHLQDLRPLYAALYK